MSLFNGFKKKKEEQQDIKKVPPITENTGDTVRITVSDDAEGYYFENMMELAIYAKRVAKDKSVYWLTGDNYIDEYKKGYQLFEQGQYSRALDSYRKCIEFNPIGLSARFEICESYLGMGNLSAARDTLLEMKDYLVEEKTIAKFYRRMGFIETEEGRYQVAAACYMYSKRFEDHPSVSQELMYIKSKSGVGTVPEKPESVLSSAGLPILEVTPLT